MERVGDKLKSRKLLVAVAGAALIAFGEQLGLDHQTSANIAHLLIAYLIAQGAHDVSEGRK